MVPCGRKSSDVLSFVTDEFLRRGLFAFLITFWGGIRCDNGWSALCDVLRILFEAFVHFPGLRKKTRSGCRSSFFCLRKKKKHQKCFVHIKRTN